MTSPEPTPRAPSATGAPDTVPATPPTPIPDEHLATAYLMRVAEPPAPALRAFVARYGAVRAAERVRTGTAPADVIEETAARRHLDLGAADLAAATACGARLITPEDAEWPAWMFTALDNAVHGGLRWAAQPVGLWVRGALPTGARSAGAVAVVGSRAATGYGEQVAAEFAHGLAAAGHAVISGAAYGIDGAAHRGALAAGGATVAVLGCGVDIAYPAGHSALLGRIATQGAVLSEYPPGTPPARHRFLVRNRLIAALGEGTLVVEAGRRSGARNTAASAHALGRVVMAVPGPVTSAMSVGCHELLRSGQATLVAGVGDVTECVGRFGVFDSTAEPDDRRPTDGLDGEAMRVYEALGHRGGRSVEQVAVDSGVAVPRARALLPALELSGLAFRCETGWRRAR